MESPPPSHSEESSLLLQLWASPALISGEGPGLIGGAGPAALIGGCAPLRIDKQQVRGDMRVVMCQMGRDSLSIRVSVCACARACDAHLCMC